MKKRNALDLTALINALNSLAEALHEYQQQSKNLFIRDATIQRFEYSYELTYKMLKRYLEITEAHAKEIDQMTFSDLIRTGTERGLLLRGWEEWSVYRYARNLTSHTYNEKKAAEVCNIIPRFLQDAQHLLKQLQTRIANNLV